MDANLHSCQNCLSKRISNFVSCYIKSLPECSHFTLPVENNVCSQCADSNSANFIKVDPPEDYPDSVHVTSPTAPPGRPVGKDTSIGSFYPTFANMNTVWKFAYHNYSTGEWDEKNVLCYLRLCGVNNATSKSILKRNDNNALPRLVDIIPPIIKSNLGIRESVVVESVMHLLFEGILKTIMTKILPDFLKSLKAFTPVYKAINIF